LATSREKVSYPPPGAKPTTISIVLPEKCSSASNAASGVAVGGAGVGVGVAGAGVGVGWPGAVVGVGVGGAGVGVGCPGADVGVGVAAGAEVGVGSLPQAASASDITRTKTSTGANLANTRSAI
jgi:hypothetical protein